MGGIGSGPRGGTRASRQTGNGLAHASDGATADPSADPSADTGPGPVTARTVPNPEPGPTITRAVPAGESLARNKGDVPGQKGRARDRARRKRLREESAEPRPARSLASDIQEAHADAADMFGLPVLVLKPHEAQRVARAFERGQDMTGFSPAGPLWEWVYIGYVLAGVYGRRILEIMRQRAAAAAASPAGSTRATGAPGAAAPAVPTPAFGSLPAAIAAKPRTAQEQSAPHGPLDATGAGNRSATPHDDALAAALAQGADNIVGFERRIPGLPVSTIEERLGGL
jgi:hypothetical protein